MNITYPTREELAALTYRSKKEIEGQVRIVTIPGRMSVPAAAPTPPLPVRWARSRSWPLKTIRAACA